MQAMSLASAMLLFQSILGNQVADRQRLNCIRPRKAALNAATCAFQNTRQIAHPDSDSLALTPPLFRFAAEQISRITAFCSLVQAPQPLSRLLI